MPIIWARTRWRITWRRVALTVGLILGLAWLLNGPQTTWAQPHQDKLRQSINTRVPSPTNGPTSTGTATAGPCVGRVLLQEGQNGYDGTSDTWIYSYLPNFPQTQDGGLKIKGSDLQSVLIRFDLQGALPPGAEILEAELVFWVDAFTESRSLDVAAFRVLRPWEAGSATWNSASSSVRWTQPGCNGVAQDRVSAADGNVTLAYRAVFRGLDVTDSVNYWLQNPDENYGLLIKGDSASTAEYYFASSRYSQVAYRPMLRIDYNLCGGTPTMTHTPGGPTQTLTSTPAMSTATPSATPQPTTQLVEATQDTYIDEWDTDANYGKLSYMNCRSNGVQKMLLQFDLALPTGAHVTSAGLVVRTGASGPPAGVTIEVTAHRLKRSWDESSATWEDALSDESWGSPGAGSGVDDYAEEILDSRTIAATNQPYAWDVTTAVQDWVNNGSAGAVANYGFILVGQAGQHALVSFTSSEMADPELRPKLQITYLIESPTPSTSATPTASDASAIHVLVYRDLNRSRVKDAAEQGLAGARIELLDASGQSLRYEVTGADGQCTFAAVAPGVYRVQERNPWSYLSTTDDQVTVQVGDQQLFVAFGDYPGSAVALPMIVHGR
jgi:hypothetical protein